MFYEFILTTKCNWNCYYCYFPKRKLSKTITHSIIDKYQWLYDILNDTIDDKDEILFQGGEIGLIDISLLEHLFTKFNKKVIIDTNGLFLEKRYHEKLDNYIDKIFYHVIENPEYLEKVKTYNTRTQIIYGVVGEPQHLYDFIRYNDHIFFDYVDIESKDPNFNYQNYYSIFEKLETLKNVNINKVKEFYKRNNIRKYQKECREENKFMSINLAEEKLSLCTTKNNHIGIDLNFKNFSEMLLSSPIKNFDGHNCNLCYRSCFASTKPKMNKSRIQLYKKIINNKEKYNV